jgi:purine-nucleoside phosphorylase
MLVLGSGLSGLADGVVDGRSRAFAELPGFPPAGVAGHTGRFVAGKLAGKEVLLQAGRYHLYEGHPADVVVAPVRIAARLGIRTVVFTNAAGGIRSDLATGSIVLLDDHLNATWRSPLAGGVREGEDRFPDMSRPYDPALQERALAAALRLGIPLARGTYGGVLGPSYESPAEVEMLRKMGADVVGMSTVPEVLAARASGLRVLALSLVTNRAASLHGKKLTHQEVLEGARDGAARMEALITEIVRTLEPAEAGGATAPPVD